MSESTASTASRIWAVDGFIDWHDHLVVDASERKMRHTISVTTATTRSPEGAQVGRLARGACALAHPLLDDLLDEVGHPNLAWTAASRPLDAARCRRVDVQFPALHRDHDDGVADARQTS